MNVKMKRALLHQAKRSQPSHSELRRIKESGFPFFAKCCLAVYDELRRKEVAFGESRSHIGPIFESVEVQYAPKDEISWANARYALSHYGEQANSAFFLHTSRLGRWFEENIRDAGPFFDSVGNVVEPSQETLEHSFRVMSFAGSFSKIMERTRGLRPTLANMREEFDYLIEVMVGARNAEVYNLVPIVGLEVDVANSVKISEETSLEQFNDQVKNSVQFQIALRSSSMSHQDVADAKGSLRLKEYSKAEQYDGVWLALTAMRLEGLERFRAVNRFVFHDGRGLVLSSTGPLNDFGPIVPWRRLTPDHLNVTSAIRIRKTLAKLSKLNTSQFTRIRLALDRFNVSHVRHRPEDTIVDLVIALESVMLPSDKESELSYRFRLNGTILCSEGEGRPPTNGDLDAFKRLYSYRSAIVHKGKTLAELLKGKVNASPLDLARHRTRMVLLAVLNRLHSGQDIDSIQSELERRSAQIT